MPPTEENVQLGPPPRWLRCPRKGDIIASKFIPFKTPLCSLYDDFVPTQFRFTVAMFLAKLKSDKLSIGLWIDLTNTDRFYFKDDVEQSGAKYVKVHCKGHGECPSESQTEAFIALCRNFVAQNPLKHIAIHCTHGFNRTGFLICSYLVEQMSWDVSAAVSSFNKARPPGIYKQDYVNSLFLRYEEDAGAAPTVSQQLPEWCNEDDSNLNEDEAAMTEAANSTGGVLKKIPIFQPELPGITAVTTVSKINAIRKKVQQLSRCKKQGFVGSQPVSMDRDNVKLIVSETSPYMVSWKADGTRYMMLVDGPNEVYMFDRDNSVFHVSNLQFPMRSDLQKHISGTLVDGELVIDTANGTEYPRFLIYDVISLQGTGISVGDKWQKLDRRLLIAAKEIVEPRTKAKQSGIIGASNEPFSVRVKEFGPIIFVEKYLSKKFQSSLPHEMDGLIFQPKNEPYIPGRCMSVLKWKPHTMNSVDFKLNIVRVQKEGMLPERKGYLFVLGSSAAFGEMKVTKDLLQYQNKIIECKFDNGQWKFMRERLDKSFPNAYDTAIGVCRSIAEPVTSEFLIEFIAENSKSDPSAPNSRKRTHESAT